MKQAFKDLKGVWPDSDNEKLYESVITDGYFTAPEYVIITVGTYIGTREEFEACRKEKWHVWNGRGEIPTGVTRALLRSGNVVNVEQVLDRCDCDIVAYTYE